MESGCWEENSSGLEGKLRRERNSTDENVRTHCWFSTIQWVCVTRAYSYMVCGPELTEASFSRFAQTLAWTATNVEIVADSSPKLQGRSHLDQSKEHSGPLDIYYQEIWRGSDSVLLPISNKSLPMIPRFFWFLKESLLQFELHALWSHWNCFSVCYLFPARLWRASRRSCHNWEKVGSTSRLGSPLHQSSESLFEFWTHWQRESSQPAPKSSSFPSCKISLCYKHSRIDRSIDIQLM